MTRIVAGLVLVFLAAVLGCNAPKQEATKTGSPDLLTSAPCVVRKEKRRSHITITDDKARLKDGRTGTAKDTGDSEWSVKVSNPSGDGKTSVLSLRCKKVNPPKDGKKIVPLTDPASTITVTLDATGTDPAATVTTAVTYVEDEPCGCDDPAATADCP